MSTFYKLLVERVHQLSLKPNKWNEKDSRKPRVDDIVLFVYVEDAKGKDWKLGRIIEVQERRVKVLYSKRNHKDDMPVLKIIERSHRDISILLSQDELAVNSENYRKKEFISDKISRDSFPSVDKN